MKKGIVGFSDILALLIIYLGLIDQINPVLLLVLCIVMLVSWIFIHDIDIHVKNKKHE